MLFTDSLIHVKARNQNREIQASYDKRLCLAIPN